MEFNGTPLHPLIVHVVVVFAPLAGIGGIVYAAVPRWRWWLRWPLVAAAVIAAVAGLIAVQSGESFKDHLGLQEVAHDHEEKGKLLRWFLLAYLVPVGLAAWLLGGPTPISSGAGGKEGRSGVVGLGVAALLVIVAVLVLVWVFLTGDAGARAAWGGQ